MSDSLWSCGLYTIRLLCPWNSPGKNTEVGLLFPSPRDLPNPGIKPGSPAFQADSLLSEPPWKPCCKPYGKSPSPSGRIPNTWHGANSFLCASLAIFPASSLPLPTNVTAIMEPRSLAIPCPLVPEIPLTEMHIAKFLLTLTYPSRSTSNLCHLFIVSEKSMLKIHE